MRSRGLQKKLRISYLVHTGLFSRLPIELRFMIWSFVIFGSDEKTPKSAISLLLCSRSFYLEVYRFLYNTIRHVIVLLPICDPEAIWTVKIKYRKLVSAWVFQGGNTIRKYVDALTYARSFRQYAYIPIEIHSACNEDRGQIVYLWKKADKLAGLFRQFSRTHLFRPRVEISLVGKWVDPDLKIPKNSTGGYEGARLRIVTRDGRPHDDFDIVILPFLQFPVRIKLPINLLNILHKTPELYRCSFIREMEQWSEYVYPLSLANDEPSFSGLMHGFHLMMDFQLLCIPGRTGRLLYRYHIDRMLNPFGKERFSSECPSAFETRSYRHYEFDYSFFEETNPRNVEDLQPCKYLPTDKQDENSRKSVVGLFRLFICLVLSICILAASLICLCWVFLCLVC